MTADTGPEGRDREEILAQVARRRSAQLVGLVIVIIFAVLALVARLANGSLFGIPFVFWGLVAMILLLGKIAFNLLAWRCPRCSGSLGATYWPRFCPNCGFRFVEESEGEATR